MSLTLLQMGVILVTVLLLAQGAFFGIVAWFVNGLLAGAGAVTWLGMFGPAVL